MKSKKTNKKIINYLLAASLFAGIPLVIAASTSFDKTSNSEDTKELSLVTETEDPSFISPQAITAETPIELVVSPTTNVNEISLTWQSSIDQTTPNTEYFFAVRRTLYPNRGWKVYSSEQTNAVTLSNSNYSAVINDSDFIVQGEEYQVSMVIDSNTLDTTDTLFYFLDDQWTGWNETVYGGPYNTIEIIEYSSGYTQLSSPPTDISFTFLESTSESLKYSFQYNNGSLNFNPIISAQIEDLTNLPGTVVDVLSSDLNVTFDPTNGTGTVDILRLSGGIDYDVNVSYDYRYKDPTFFALGTATTDASIPKIGVDTHVDFTNNDVVFYVDITADPTLVDNISVWNSFTADTVGTSRIPATADIIIEGFGWTQNLSDDQADEQAGDTGGRNYLSGRHIFFLGQGDRSFIKVTITVYLLDMITPVEISSLIIDDRSTTAGKLETAFEFNGQEAKDAVVSYQTDVSVTPGSLIGDLDISWDIIYPTTPITLSDIKFVFEISPIDPAGEETFNWINVTNQTSNFAPDMKSATITNLIGEEYSEGVWVRLSINFVSANTKLSQFKTTNKVAPKAPPAINSLSTGALIGIIGGSVAGVLLIGLGVWYILKRKNQGSLEETKDADDTKEPKPTPKKTTTKKPKSTTKKTTTKKSKPITKTPTTPKVNKS